MIFYICLPYLICRVFHGTPSASKGVRTTALSYSNIPIRRLYPYTLLGVLALHIPEALTRPGGLPQLYHRDWGTDHGISGTPL